MIAEFFDIVTDVIENFGLSLQIAIEQLIDLFYVKGQGFTTLGTLALLGLGMSLVFFGIRFVLSFLR